MPPITLSHSLPLPRAWPRRVRSAAVHAISLADLAFTKTLSWAADSRNPRLRHQAELGRLRREVSLLREEIRTKDVRMGQIEPHRRPYYSPTARLAILELRAARGWSLAQTARTFLVSPLTIASWTGRLEEEKSDARLRLPVPVNKFPDFVGYLVRRLKTLCPSLGKVKIAQVLARAGLHLGPTPEPRVACGLDDCAHRPWLLDSVDPLRQTAGVAVLLVGPSRRRPFLEEGDAIRDLSVRTFVSGRSVLPGGSL